MATPQSVLGSRLSLYYGPDASKYSGGTWTPTVGTTALTQATGANRPTADTTTLPNGSLSLSCNGTTDIFPTVTLAEINPAWPAIANFERMWFGIIRASATTGPQVLFRPSHSFLGFDLAAEGNQKLTLYTAGAGTNAVSNNGLNDNTLHTVIITGNDSTHAITMYIDGVAQTTVGNDSAGPFFGDPATCWDVFEFFSDTTNYYSGLVAAMGFAITASGGTFSGDIAALHSSLLEIINGPAGGGAPATQPFGPSGVLGGGGGKHVVGTGKRRSGSHRRGHFNWGVARAFLDGLRSPKPRNENSSPRIRANRYGEPMVSLMGDKSHALSDENSYFRASSGQTAFNIPSNIGGFSGTAPFAIFLNTSPIASVQLDYISLPCRVVGGTAGDICYVAGQLDTKDRTFTVGATEKFIIADPGSSVRLFLGPAASSPRNTTRTVFGKRSWDTDAALGDTVTISFGPIEIFAGFNVVGGVAATCIQVPPVVIGPLGMFILYAWGESQNGTFGSFTFDAGWWER